MAFALRNVRIEARLKILTVIALLCAPSVLRAQASAPDPLDHVAAVAFEACRMSSGPGHHLTVEGEAGVAANGFIWKRLLGVDGEARGNASLSSWEGVQQVLREHQLADNQSLRECSRALLPELLKFKLEWLKLQSGQATTPAQHQSDLGCYPAGALAQAPVPIQAGTCFEDAASSRIAYIRRAVGDLVEFDNANGKRIRCYPGDVCTFGFPDRAPFRLQSRDDQVYLVGGLQ